MKNILRFNVSHLKFCVIASFFISVSCERIEKEELQNQMVSRTASISKGEIQRILTSQVNLESFQVTDDIKFSLPDNYYFQTALIEKGEYETQNTFGKLDFSSKENYSKVELHNSLFVDYSLYDESVYVIKEKDPDLLHITDVKADFGIENIYYEDKNSIIFSADDSFTTVHFQYDINSKTYLIYTGNISWAKKFPAEEKLDLAFYFLRNAKNLLNKNFSKKEFTWQDYVENYPKIEINLVKNMFANFEKEMKVFLDKYEPVAPKIDEFSFVELYRFNSNKKDAFFEYLNNLSADDTEEDNKWLRDIFSNVLNYDSTSKYKIIQKENTSIVEVTKFDEEGTSYGKQYGVYCILSYENKAFVLKNKSELNKKSVDFFVTMFNYFSKNNSLEIAKKGKL
jgi:hypothetical protein